MSIIAPLIEQLRKESKEEKERLKKSQEIKIEKLDDKFQKEIKELEKKLKDSFEEKKERTLKNYKEEKKFELKMKELSLKEELFEEAVLKVKKELIKLPFKERKVFYKEEIKKVNPNNFKKVIAPLSKKREIESIFKNVEIIESPLIEEGFIIEGERFSFEISLSSAINGVASDKKGVLSFLLFA